MMTEFLLESWSILCQLSPWLLLGLVLSATLHALLPENFIRRRFHGRWGVVQAVLLGVPLPLCSCGVVPAGIGLKNQGADDGAAVGFLISTPQTGVDSVFVSASFFGWPFAVFKMLAALVMGIIGGILANSVSGKAVVGTNSSQVSREEDFSTKKNLWRSALEHAWEVFQSFWWWLLVGVFASAAIGVLVPTAWLQGLESLGSLAAMGIVLLISIPLYVCATASVPLAAALVAGGLPTSAALVFLMAGPATNTTTIGAVYARFGWRTLMVYLLVIVFGSFVGGWLFDTLLTAPDVSPAMLHHHENWLSIASAIVVVVLILMCAGSEAAQRLRGLSSDIKSDSDDHRFGFQIEGITCANCVRSIETALATRKAHLDFSIDFPKKRMTFRRKPGMEEIRDIQQILKELGFSIKLEGA